MFSDLIARLTAPKPKPLPELDSQLALAAMLVRTAKSDGDYAVAEIQRIDRILAKSFGLNPVAAARMRADGERLEAQAPDDGRFAQAIVDSVGVGERESVLAALYQVARADGRAEQREMDFVHRAAERLGLDTTAEARASAQASGATVIPNLTRHAEE